MKNDEEMALQPILGEEESEEEEEDDDADVHESDPVALDEDTFGMSVCSLTRDTYYLSKDGPSLNRYVRLFVTLFLCFVTLGIQILLLTKVKEFVSARAVHDIRIAYSKFEYVLYDCENTPSNCHQTVNGKWRGNSKDLFPPTAEASKKLTSMGDGEQDDICRIPLSQPVFFGIVLLIWCLTCWLEMRRACEMMYYIANLKRVPRMMFATTKDGVSGSEDADQGMVITGMTLIVKVLIFFAMFVPRMCITCFLLWCGCRWLLATNNFGDLILNAVALEFVLLIKDVMYAALTSTRNKKDLSVTTIMPYPLKESSHWYNFVNTTLVLLFWIVMVYLYMTQWQQVLPNYNWDVAEVCVEYIKTRYAV